jgi:DnaJ-class molecular chaperone
MKPKKKKSSYESFESRCHRCYGIGMMIDRNYLGGAWNLRLCRTCKGTGKVKR